MIKQTKKQEQQNLYRIFIADLESVLKDNENLGGKSQKVMMNRLFKLERSFKSKLLSSKDGAQAYEHFVYYILNIKKNKLSIRPYFRERQDTFSKKIFQILLTNDTPKLYKYRINYLFAKWILENCKSNLSNYSELLNVYKEILNLRTELCEANLPLAINRAKLFFSKTQENHLEHMDLIQDCSKGLLEAIDNFTPPFKTVFRSVAIGRMVLNMSENYSATLVKLPPKDKRILYRTRKAKLRDQDIEKDALKSFVNESFTGTSSDDIALIDAAANKVCSIDAKVDDGTSVSDTLFSNQNLGELIESRDLKFKILSILKDLTPLEAKVLFLRLGDITEIS